jgi:multiple sugar transport system ATP-binding protein
MASASLLGLEKRFGAVGALLPFDLEVEDGELVTILGPSGCGKSTLLRLIAGLERADGGEVRLDGARIDHLPPGRRDVAMVFQSYALYPHMTVRENVEFPLRMRRAEPSERARRTDEVASLLELVPLLDRRPAALSGGERQRVALARALVRRPRLFLLDEPLSNLDVRLRDRVRRFFRDLQRRVGVTTLYVTHDQMEALTLGHRVVVLDQGRIQQVDAPAELYERPANRFVAGFVGQPAMNLLPARVAADGYRIDERTTIEVPGCPSRDAGPPGTAVVLGVRPEAFRPIEERGNDADVAAARDRLVAIPDAESKELLGGETVCTAHMGETAVIVRLFGNVSRLPERVAALATSLHVFDEAGRRLGSRRERA